MQELEKLRLELKPLEDLKTEIDRKSAQRTTAVVWGGLGYMALQFGLLARLTWWEYSWDIMEPVTYFVGYGTAMVAYAYFVLTRQVRSNIASSGYSTLRREAVTCPLIRLACDSLSLGGGGGGQEM